MLNVYQLPDDLITGPPPPADEVIIRHYQSGDSSVKNRIILRCNMINLLVSGTKTVVYPHTTTVINAGELVVLSSGNMLTSELIRQQQPFSSVLLYFSNNVLYHFLSKHSNPVAQPQTSQFVIYKQDAFITHYIQSLLLLLTTPGALSAELKRLKLEELLAYLLHADAAKLQSLRAMAEAPEDYTIRKTVESHIGDPITVEELAFLCNMSRSTFQRRFERLYGTSPQKYLRRQKLQMAAGLLVSEAAQPSDVYFKVGYQNHASFSAAFRGQFGVTPSQYQADNMSAPR